MSMSLKCLVIDEYKEFLQQIYTPYTNLHKDYNVTNAHSIT